MESLIDEQGEEYLKTINYNHGLEDPFPEWLH